MHRYMQETTMGIQVIKDCDASKPANFKIALKDRMELKVLNNCFYLQEPFCWNWNYPFQIRFKVPQVIVLELETTQPPGSVSKTISAVTTAFAVLDYEKYCSLHCTDHGCDRCVFHCTSFGHTYVHLTWTVFIPSSFEAFF